MPALTNLSHLDSQFIEVLALIVAACFIVPLFKQLRLGTVLGYLAAGVVIGYFLKLGITSDPEELLHFAEFGIVLFLFVIGLELEPARLWAMRRDIFGLGMVQVLLCGAALSLPVLLYGYSWQVALVTGFGLALSSTALVMQRIDEERLRRTAYGGKALSILLFQDLAIIPLLLMVQLLAPFGDDLTLTEALTAWAIAVGAIAGLIAVGAFLLDPMFALMARARMPEIMTASALGVVIAAAILMKLVGLSYAMGAFIAGVMLAESSYRHEVEANIEPFRGLFLGLFFMAVGISLDLAVLYANWSIILAAIIVFTVLKAAAIYGASRLMSVEHNLSVKLSFGLAQHGEFGFVLFAAAISVYLIDANTASILIAIVVGSMAIAPLIERLSGKFVHLGGKREPGKTVETLGSSVLVIGFGRFGQVFVQTLVAREMDVTILDSDPDRVIEAEVFGSHVHFGDGRRRDVLKAAGADKARMIAVCVNDSTSANQIVSLVQAHYPNALLFVRSYDRRHSILLFNRNVDFAVRETFESAIRMGSKALDALGFDEEAVLETIEDIRTRDRDRLLRQAEEEKIGHPERAMEEIPDIRPKPLRKRRWQRLIGGRVNPAPPPDRSPPDNANDK